MVDSDSMKITPCGTPPTGPSDSGYEPNAMELTNTMEFTGTTELNDAAFSDINFQDYTARSSDLYIDADALGKLLEEVHRDYADYRRAEGVSVSPSSVSVMVDRTEELVKKKKKIAIILFVVSET